MAVGNRGNDEKPETNGDVSCKIRFINHTCADYLGVDPNTVISNLLSKYIPCSYLDRVVSTGQPEPGDKYHFGDGENKEC